MKNILAIIVPPTYLIPAETKMAIRQFFKNILFGTPTNEFECLCFLSIYALMTIYLISEIIKAIIWFIKSIKKRK